MPRKPNYKFDRMERDRQKAAKKAERLKAKLDKTDDKTDAEGNPIPLESASETTPELPSEPSSGEEE